MKKRIFDIVIILRYVYVCKMWTRRGLDPSEAPAKAQAASPADPQQPAPQLGKVWLIESEKKRSRAFATILFFLSDFNWKSSIFNKFV